jgi:hypothetical protein
MKSARYAHACSHCCASTLHCSAAQLYNLREVALVLVAVAASKVLQRWIAKHVHVVPINQAVHTMQFQENIEPTSRVLFSG